MLREAGEYIATLPESEHDQPEQRSRWQCCLQAAGRRWLVMFARIGMMLRALHRQSQAGAEKEAGEDVPDREVSRARRIAVTVECGPEVRRRAAADSR